MFDKLDAYNLIANLVPGAALVYALHFSGFPAPNPEKIGAFLLTAFVVGVATNRLGSLVLDPILRRVGFLHQKDYQAFLGPEKDDAKLETLVANSGLYRTFVTAGLVYLILLAINWMLEAIGIETNSVFIPFVALGMVIFLFAFQKEDDYIRTRMNAANGNSQEPDPNHT